MSKTSTTVDIRNFTRQTVSWPGFSYSEIASTVLPGWDISLVFTGTTRATRLNRQLRGKTYAPNILSYETGKKSGEIIMCLEIAKKQAPGYGVTYKQFVAFLFIHGLLHLKGLPHGTTMEKHERTLLQRFAGAAISYNDEINHASTNRNRNRHRHTPDESSRGGRTRRPKRS